MSSGTTFSESTFGPLPTGTGSIKLDAFDSAASEVVQGRVLAFTESVFGAQAAISPALDPEYDEAYFAVRVSAAGSVEEILRRNDQWHREIEQHAGDAACKFRLALNIE